jgi:alkylation response protein AidB-like acyl-CoA dehydrogenase
MSAKVIADDVEAPAVAAALTEESDRLSTSGLLAVTVPTEHGGAGRTYGRKFSRRSSDCRPRPTPASPRSRTTTSCT